MIALKELIESAVHVQPVKLMNFTTISLKSVKCVQIIATGVQIFCNVLNANPTSDLSTDNVNSTCMI